MPTGVWPMAWQRGVGRLESTFYDSWAFPVVKNANKKREV
jgi:hypothetical protein